MAIRQIPIQFTHSVDSNDYIFYFIILNNKRNFKRSRFDRKYEDSSSAPRTSGSNYRGSSNNYNSDKASTGTSSTDSVSYSSSRATSRPAPERKSFEPKPYRGGSTSYSSNRSTGDSSNSGSSYGRRGGNAERSMNRDRYPRAGGTRDNARPFYNDRPVRPYGRGRMDNKNLDQIIRFIKDSVNKPKVIVEVKEEEKFVGEIKDFVTDSGLLRNLTQKGFTKATPIQAMSIPVIREGKDILGLANTGTGKTAAYLIPLIEECLKNRAKTLILVPTRELAIQIKNEIYLFTRDMPIKSEIVIGGADMYRQIQNLKRNPDFVVGTPGRIKDQKQRGHINIKNYDNIVLDEADRMLDMGFIGEIKDLLKERKSDVQSLFFSATMDKKVAMLIKEFCKSYETIEISAQKVTDLIEQKIVTYEDEGAKMDKVADILKDPEFGKSIIFVNTKHRADKLMKHLNEYGLRTDALHGDKSQNLRQRIMRNYKESRFDHLIATDVAARGIDVKDVTHVINYDVPATVEDYIHRVGRTGRAGKLGIALTLIKA